jgi:hypothetical protein
MPKQKLQMQKKYALYLMEVMKVKIFIFAEENMMEHIIFI